MPRISKNKRSKISEQIMAYLYNISPEAVFTSKISEEIVRDEEFTKSLLEDLEKNKLVTKIKKSQNGNDYSRWIRWRISTPAFEAYKNLK
jgi:predicted transcriptional regulator with HTH domain